MTENKHARVERENALELDAKAKKALLHVLAGDAKMYESEMPNVQIGAVCSGSYLIERGYQRVGQNRMFKREGNKYFCFLAVREVENQTVTAVPLHPFYELEGKD